MSQYPIISAGQRITAQLLQSLLPNIIVKQNATSRTATTTYADDPDLTFQLGANSKYLVEFYIRYSASATTGTIPNIKTAWTVPSGASGNRTMSGPGSSATDTNGDNMAVRFGVHGFATTALAYGHRGITTSQLFFLETGVVTTSSAGTCALQWAQNISSAVAATVASDSFMRVTQLA